jgi:hypothetical protein
MKREITNRECDIAQIKGLLIGLTHTYDSLVKVSKDPEYRGDLTEEIERVMGEIKLNEEKLISLESQTIN